MSIASIRIQNFKSIRDSGPVAMRPLNILIGPNGVGKSNFISFFKFLSKLYDQELQLYVSKAGRADNFLYFGRKHSDFLAGELLFDNKFQNEYQFRLEPDALGNFVFAYEKSNFYSGGLDTSSIGIPGKAESGLKTSSSYRDKYLRQHISSFRLFHFHDTSATARVMGPGITTDYAQLQEDGGNLAAFLYRLQESSPAHFKNIERVIQSIAPFFGRFYLAPDEINPGQIFLRWQERGADQLFTAQNLSDGTLRMMCLATLLLQPQLPGTIIIDEPELGLHPFAVVKLAAMLKAASQQTQIITSTQSVNLVSEFSADDVIVVDRIEGQSVFTRQSSDSLQDWLAEYSLGELWEKNILRGRPA